MNACCFLVALEKMSMFRPRKVFFFSTSFPKPNQVSCQTWFGRTRLGRRSRTWNGAIGFGLGVSWCFTNWWKKNISIFKVSMFCCLFPHFQCCCYCCCGCGCCCCCYIFSWIDIAWNRFLFTKARSPGNKMVCRRRCGYDGGMCGMVNLFVFLTRCILPPKKGEHNGGFDPPNNGRALALFMSWLLWSVIMHIYVSCLCIIRKFWKFLNDESAEHTKRLWLICRPWPPWQWTKYSSWEIEMSFEPYLKDDRYCI